MPENAVLATSAHFKSWCERRFPVPPKKLDLFEYYCLELFTRSYDLSDSQLSSGRIGGSMDGGADGFYMFANGELVDAETELDPKHPPPDFKLLILQVKSEEGFSPKVIDRLFWLSDDLLDLSRQKANYHSVYKAEVVSLIRLFKDKFGLIIGETPPLSVEYVYIVKTDVEPNEDCRRSVKTIRERVLHYFPQARVNFRFVNATTFYAEIQTRPPNSKTLLWASQPMLTEQGQIGLVRLSEYYKFVREQDGKIAERFFDSNVRGYWQSSPINRGISETLKSVTGGEFWLLNNGITILTDKTTTTGKFLEVEISDPQIVNGLQTSRQIFSYFSAIEKSNEAVFEPMQTFIDQDSRRVLVRLITASDKEVRDDVIRCTNSQNPMPAEALRATDAVHRQLETVFLNYGLFYDRRKGHHKDSGRPVAQIVSLVEVLQAMLSVVLQKPDQARGRPRDYFKKTELYQSVFGEEVYPLSLYVKATQIARRVDEFLEGEDIEQIHRRNIHSYLCMYVSCVASNDSYAIESLLLKIDVGIMSDEFLRESYGHVFGQYGRAAIAASSDAAPDYDAVARGASLVKVIVAELRRRLNPKKQKKLKKG